MSATALLRPIGNRRFTPAGILAILLIAGLACSPAKTSSSPSDAGNATGMSDAGLLAGQSGSASVFQGAHMTGSNRQTDVTVDLPTGLFTNITLVWKLSCPSAGCDPWDRIAELHVVRNTAT